MTCCLSDDNAVGSMWDTEEMGYLYSAGETWLQAQVSSALDLSSLSLCVDVIEPCDPQASGCLALWAQAPHCDRTGSL